MRQAPAALRPPRIKQEQLAHRVAARLNERRQRIALIAAPGQGVTHAARLARNGTPAARSAASVSATLRTTHTAAPA